MREDIDNMQGKKAKKSLNIGHTTGVDSLLYETESDDQRSRYDFTKSGAFGEMEISMVVSCRNWRRPFSNIRRSNNACIWSGTKWGIDTKVNDSVHEGLSGGAQSGIGYKMMVLSRTIWQVSVVV